MRGNTTIPFTELLADTICTHGIEWSRQYYTSRGMPDWEWRFWLHALSY